MNKYIEENARKIDYLISLSPVSYDRVLEELQTYQNPDGGFGYGLELDIQSAMSNIPSTNIAIEYIKKMPSSQKLETMIKHMVQYYESLFDRQNHRWYMVEESVNQYPRAIWWNFESRLSFGLLNPTPEILGFLYLHHKHITRIDMVREIRRMVETIKDKLPNSDSFHDLLSVLRFHRDIPYIQDDIKDIVKHKIETMLNHTEETYHLRAHQVALIVPDLVTLEKLQEDIDMLKQELDEKGYIECTWEWNQYTDVFIEIKPYWNAFLTRKAIDAIEQFKKRIWKEASSTS